MVLVVLVILLQGFLNRETAHPEAEPQPTAVPSPTATPFRPDLEKVPLTYFSDYWLQLGERSHHLLVSMGPTGAKAVRVSPGYALGTVGAADQVIVAPGEAPEGQLVALDGREELALFRLAADVGTNRLPTAAGLHAGAWLAAVTVDEDHSLQVTPGHLASTPAAGADELEVAIPFPRTLNVAAIVDLDARLAGVALRGRRGVRVISAEGAGQLVSRLASSPACRAVEVAPLPDQVRSALRLKNGVMVKSVARHSFASPPDLHPGDIVLQVGISYVTTPDEFDEAWDAHEPGARARFLVSRGSRRVVRRMELPGRDCRPDSATPRELPLLGTAAQWTAGDGGEGPQGFRLLLVPEDSRAAGAGLEPGDVLVAVDGQPLAWPDARRLVAPWTSRHEPVLTVRRDGDAQLVVLPEALDEDEPED